MPVFQYTGRDGNLMIADLDIIDAETAAQLLATCHPSCAAQLAEGIRQAIASQPSARDEPSAAQRAIAWGDCFRRDWPGPPPGRAGAPACTIWGQVITRRQIHPGDATLIRRKYAQGWRYTWCWSAADPEGEPGFMHVTTMTPITRAEFENARARGWRP